MKLKYLILLLVIFVTSCNDFLDVKPVGKLIPDKIEDFENILNHSNTLNFHMMNNNNSSFYAMLGDNLSISENQDKFLFIRSFVNLELYAAYIYSLPYENPEDPQIAWEWGVYRAVELFNTVIDGIEGLGEEQANSPNGKAVLAQAKAGRAWSYMINGLGYGPMYDPNGPNDTKTIPYRITYDPTIANPDLSTTKELMELVKKDLDAALDAPENVVNPSRANRAAVHALRAEYFMYMRDWTNMLKEATEAWDRSILKGGVDNLIYNFNQFKYREKPNVIPEPGTDREIYLDLDDELDLSITKSYNKENLFYRIASHGPSAANGSATFYPSDDFLSLFDQKDRRYQLFALNFLGYSIKIGDDLYQDGIRKTYCRGSKMNENQGITYPQLLLMKAEAEARTNNLSGALSDLNLLRKYRYTGDNTDLPNGNSLNQDALLYEILKERRRELPIATYQRTLDIKRYVYDAGKPWSQTSITHKIGNRAYSAPVNNQFFTLPIANAIIKYNPSWGLELDNRIYDPIANK